jgi:polar amino acid transport system substrate-binding protein
MRRPHPKRLGRPAVRSRVGGLLTVLFACGILFACGALIGHATGAAAKPQTPPNRAEARVLRGGWFPLDPYQYREYRRGTAVLTGYDIEIQRALGRILSVDIQLPEVVWEEHLADVAAGKADIAAGVTFSEERNRYAYFSKPYRQETDVLVLRRGAGARYRFNDVAQMLEAFERQHFRLGVIAGFTYASDKVNAYIADPAHDATIVKVGDDTENLRNLLAGVIDGFIADRIVAATVAWRQQKSGEIEEYPLYMSTPIHFMLSRATQSPAMLDRLNGAIDEIRRSGEIKRIADTYALPILIHQTLDANWFKALALLGTIAFTLSGVVLAHAGRYTLFGALVLASIPALGGGVLRDLIVQREPLGVVRDPMFVLAVIATVLLGMAFFKLASFGRTERLVEPLRARRALGTHLIEVCDALGLAAFTVLGVVIILDTSVHPLWLWGPISAVIGSSFGGLIRDMIRQDGELASLKGELYPEIAVGWGLAFSLFLGWEADRLQPEEIWLGVVVTIAGAFLTRMAAVAFGLKGWPYA